MRTGHVEVEALARDRGRLVVFDQDLLEAARVAFRFLNDARVVTVGFLQQPRRQAARAGDDVVGVGLALVLLPFAVLARLDRVVECGTNLLGRL